MHLIRTIPGHIEDLENKVTYLFSPDHPEWEVHTEATVHVMAWFADGEDTTDLAFGAKGVAFWAYLESLLKFDATKAQDAPRTVLIEQSDGTIGEWPLKD